MRAQVGFNDIMSLEEKIRMLPNRAEKAINRVLHTRGIEIATREMTNLLPVSRVSNKKHAKESKWSTSEMANLEFVVKSKGGAANKKGSFGYLVFPDEGRGPSNPWAQHFSDRSLQKSAPKILAELDEALQELLEEGL
ncbi:hypothetical protein [Lysinibacillus parviboronicapiens]|uniref:hypothetical protein n=1 Tax=Lysinibacillus parviboronicapiens TaxID=436516 RepID=UPI000D3D93DF|nr:hypothetical protein [Lysinibacillus parviboronicapiens]